MCTPSPPLPVTGDQSELDRLRRRVAELEEMVASLSETLHQERLRLERGPVVAVSWDERAGWPVSYVSSNIDQFGYSADDFTSNHIAYMDFIHPDDRERVIAEIAHLRASQALPLTRTEYRVVCADGTVRYVADFSRLAYDVAGKIVRVDGYLLDVTGQTTGVGDSVQYTATGSANSRYLCTFASRRANGGDNRCGVLVKLPGGTVYPAS